MSMFKFNWKRVAAPIALYSYGVYNERKIESSKKLSKELIILAKKNDFENFECKLLSLDHNIDVYNVWKVAQKAAKEVTKMSEGSNVVTYIKTLKNICDKIS